jgi:hypothetical protein
MNERKVWPHGSTSWRRLRRCVGAPSVALPENVIPSAGATRASFQSTSTIAVLLPESFRGGCSFGVGSPISPAMIVVCTFSGLSLLSVFRRADAVVRLVRVGAEYRKNASQVQRFNMPRLELLWTPSNLRSDYLSH